MSSLLFKQGEIECAYYMKTGHCKYGITCKYHHPQMPGLSVAAPARPSYAAVQSSVPTPEQYGGDTTNYGVPIPPLFPGSYV